MYRPLDAVYYHKLGSWMSPWEVNYFQYLANGYKPAYISHITKIRRRKYDASIARLKDDLHAATTTELLVILLRKKIIK